MKIRKFFFLPEVRDPAQAVEKVKESKNQCSESISRVRG